MHNYGDHARNEALYQNKWKFIAPGTKGPRPGAGSIWRYIMKMYETFCQNCEIYGPFQSRGL